MRTINDEQLTAMIRESGFAKVRDHYAKGLIIEADYRRGWDIHRAIAAQEFGWDVDQGRPIR